MANASSAASFSGRTTGKPRIYSQVEKIHTVNSDEKAWLAAIAPKLAHVSDVTEAVALALEPAMPELRRVKVDLVYLLVRGALGDTTLSRADIEKLAELVERDPCMYPRSRRGELVLSLVGELIRQQVGTDATLRAALDRTVDGVSPGGGFVVIGTSAYSTATESRAPLQVRIPDERTSEPAWAVPFINGIHGFSADDRIVVLSYEVPWSKKLVGAFDTQSGALLARFQPELNPRADASQSSAYTADKTNWKVFDGAGDATRHAIAKEMLGAVPIVGRSVDGAKPWREKVWAAFADRLPSGFAEPTVAMAVLDGFARSWSAPERAAALYAQTMPTKHALRAERVVLDVEMSPKPLVVKDDVLAAFIEDEVYSDLGKHNHFVKEEVAPWVETANALRGDRRRACLELFLRGFVVPYWTREAQEHGGATGAVLTGHLTQLNLALEENDHTRAIAVIRAADGERYGFVRSSFDNITRSHSPAGRLLKLTNSFDPSPLRLTRLQLLRYLATLDLDEITKQ